MSTTERRLEAILARAKHEILADDHFHTAEDLAKLYGKEPTEFKQSLEEAESRGEIFSIKLQGQAFYPDFAFSVDGEAISPTGLSQVIKVLTSINDGWGMAFWFLSPNNFLKGQRPADALNQGTEEVLAAAHQEVSEVMHG